MENLVFGPQWAHICTAKELRIEFLALTYPFIEISNHTILPQEVTCFHMSKVICLPSWINLYLHLELSWIWVEIFCTFVNSICERNHLVSYHFFLKYLVYTLVYHRTQCWIVNIQEKFENISASLNFKFIFWFFFIQWFLNLKLWNFSLFSHLWFGLRIFSEFSDISQPGICTLKLWNFFTQVLLELDFENFLKFFQTQLTWTGLWKFFEFFSTCLIEVELWKFFEFFQTCTDCDWTLKIFWTCVHIWLNLYTTVELCWHLLTQLYCTWLMFPLQRFRHSIKIFSKYFIIQ